MHRPSEHPPVTAPCASGYVQTQTPAELPHCNVAAGLCVEHFSCLKSTGRPGSSEVPRNPLTRWDVSSTPVNGIFLTKILKNKNKNAQRVEND